MSKPVLYFVSLGLKIKTSSNRLSAGLKSSFPIDSSSPSHRNPKEDDFLQGPFFVETTDLTSMIEEKTEKLRGHCSAGAPEPVMLTPEIIGKGQNFRSWEASSPSNQ